MGMKPPAPRSHDEKELGNILPLSHLFDICLHVAVSTQGLLFLCIYSRLVWRTRHRLPYLCKQSVLQFMVQKY